MEQPPRIKTKEPRFAAPDVFNPHLPKFENWRAMVAFFLVVVIVLACCLVAVSKFSDQYEAEEKKADAEKQRAEYMQNWEPKPGVEKHPTHRPYYYDESDPFSTCERCGSTNVLRLSTIEKNRFGQYKENPKYICWYCGHTRSRFE